MNVLTTVLGIPNVDQLYTQCILLKDCFSLLYVWDLTLRAYCVEYVKHANNVVIYLHTNFQVFNPQLRRTLGCLCIVHATG